MAYFSETLRAAAPILRLQIAVQAQAGQLGGKGGLVLAGEQTGNAIFNGIAHADRMDAQHGQAGGHGFDDGKRMDFRHGGGYEDIAHGQVARQFIVGQHAGEMDAAGRAGLGRQLVSGPALPVRRR